MEKILLAIDVNQVNVNVLDFACFIAKLTHSKLTGVFLEDLIGDPEPALKMMHGSTYVESIVAAAVPENKEKIRLCNIAVESFKSACENRGVNYIIQREPGSPIDAVIAESRFADLLILDPEMSLDAKPGSAPTKLVKEIFKKSECPIVVAPFRFSGIDEIVFAYDGSISCVFAIKQFVYLFPQFRDKRLTILQIDENPETPVIEKKRIGELLQTHFSNISFHALHGKASDELFGYLLEKENIFVVMGAFGKSIVRAFHRKSTAELAIKTTNLPFFIAHP